MHRRQLAGHHVDNAKNGTIRDDKTGGGSEVLAVGFDIGVGSEGDRVGRRAVAEEEISFSGDGPRGSAGDGGVEECCACFGVGCDIAVDRGKGAGFDVVRHFVKK